MLNLSLIDKSQTEMVPDSFFEFNASAGLRAALHSMGEAVIESAPIDERSPDAALQWSQFFLTLRQLTDDSLRILPMRIDFPQESDALQLAQDCGQYLHRLNEIEVYFGGSGIAVLALEASTPDQSRLLRQSEELREFLERRE